MGAQASGRAKQSLSNQIRQSWSQPQILHDSRRAHHPLKSPQKCSFYGSPFSWRILEVKRERQGKVESVPTRVPMINDAPNTPRRFSKQLCVAALECGISCPLGALAPPQSSGAPSAYIRAVSLTFPVFRLNLTTGEEETLRSIPSPSSGRTCPRHRLRKNMPHL